MLRFPNAYVITIHNSLLFYAISSKVWWNRALKAIEVLPHKSPCHPRVLLNHFEFDDDVVLIPSNTEKAQSMLQSLKTLVQKCNLRRLLKDQDYEDWVHFKRY